MVFTCSQILHISDESTNSVGFDRRLVMDKKLPSLDEEGQIKINVLMELFYKQFWTFSEFLNDAPDKIPTYKYADFILFALKEELKRRHPNIDK